MLVLRDGDRIIEITRVSWRRCPKEREFKQVEGVGVEGVEDPWRLGSSWLPHLNPSMMMNLWVFGVSYFQSNPLSLISPKQCGHTVWVLTVGVTAGCSFEVVSSASGKDDDPYTAQKLFPLRFWQKSRTKRWPGDLLRNVVPLISLSLWHAANFVVACAIFLAL